MGTDNDKIHVCVRFCLLYTSYIFFLLSMFVLIVHSVRFISEEVLGKEAET